MITHSRYRLTLFCLLLFPCVLVAQERRDSSIVRPDTSVVRDSAGVALRDTTALPDSLKPVPSPSGIDSVVNYAATDSVIYALDNKTMFMYGKGNIRYKELGLKAENIDINWNTSILNARGVPDSTDTSGTKYRGLPDMVDGGETYHGSVVLYNFRTRKGKIDLGKTEIERGWYYGEEIKKVDEKVLFVADGRYTTCDLEHPHYFFFSPEMKIIVGDKIVARPISLTIAGVPVFALPFGIFPTQRGRRSGLIAPAYGESANRGRYLTHLGYYWAINDYMDLNVRADGYAKGGYTIYSDYRYALRYNFNGGISGSYGKTILGERGDPGNPQTPQFPGYSQSTEFRMQLLHNQEFDPTTRLNVNFTLMSNNFFQNTSNNLNELLTQNVRSNATLSKFWEGTPNSMTVNLSRDQNLGTGEITEVFPNILFNRTQSFPFRSSKRGFSSPQAWYDLIGYSYSAQFQNQHTKALVTPSLPESLRVYREDRRWGAQHQARVDASPKAGYVTVTPYVNLYSKWYGSSIRRGLNDRDSVVTNELKGFKTVSYFDMGVSLGTKLYGILRPNILGITGIRHQLSPSISYIYQPDFSKPQWHYYGSYVDTSGVQQKYSYFEQGIYGGAPNEERQAIALRIGNVFEMKTVGDSAGQENKFQLLNLDLGTSYNFARDSLKFDEVGASFRTSIGQWLTIGGSSSFNLYKFQADPPPADPNMPRTGRRVNKFLLSEGRIADLTNFSISVGTRLSGEKKRTTAGPVRTAADSTDMATRKTYIGLYDQELPDFSIPWNLDLNWNFNQSQPTPFNKFRNSTVSVGLGFNLTEFWKFSANTSYDLLNKQFAAPQITIYRDLHCWEMNFSWVPTGFYRNFRLEIRLKAPQLQDIKVTKQGSARDVY